MGCLGNMTAVEKLMALAADWEDRSCGLYVHLREGSEGRWGVNGFSRGSVSEILREIADRALEEQADLKMFAERVHGMLWGDGWHDLDEIADMLDEELNDLEVLRSVDSEADRLVREHGGLDAVKERLERVETWDADKAAILDLCAECGGIDGVRARMLPDGIEWPMFEDGEPVRLGGIYEKTSGTPGTAMTMQLRLYGDVPTWIIGKGKGKVNVKPGERVKRPAPKVLDADGAEICVGDTVYSTRDTESGTVVYAYPPGDDGQPSVKVGAFWHHASELTHRAPVLAADGRPLHEGETVYKLDDDRPYTLKRFDGDHVYINAGGSSFDIWTFPNKLTHERPDSWERLEEDAGKNPFDYCKDVGHRLDTCENSEAYKARDLVRRARALEDRGQR